jgi:valyl-tRNA synthetase
MLGDSARGFTPGQRYKILVGKKLKHTLLGYEVPIVGEDVMVDPAFGTGAVKVRQRTTRTTLSAAVRPQH